MEHLQIAFDLLVIMIGLAALSIAVFWAARTGKAELRDFSILYACFTLVLVVVLLKKYLSLNVEGYSARAWYWLSAADQVFSFVVIVAGIHFFAGVYGIKKRTAITLACLGIMLVCILLLFSPSGAVLDPDAGTIRFGSAFKVSTIGYFAAFTVMLALGVAALRRNWNTQERNFLTGLLVFAAIGYVETLLNLPAALRQTTATLSQEGGFLYSSIPYALYGAFLIVYFLRYPVSAPLAMDALPEAFLARYGITDREREIILKVVQGKSNADIASELFISLATVKTHLHNIYTKMGVESRFDLLARVRSGQ